MEIWLPAAFLFIAVSGLAWATRRRWQRLRAHLGAMASGERPGMLIGRGPTWFCEAARDLNRISELLAERDRQAADEGLNLRAVLGSMVEGVLIADRNQRLRVVNQALLRMFGLVQPPADRTVIEVFRSHDLRAAVAETLESGAPQVREMRIETGVGGEYRARQFEVNLSPLGRVAGAPPEGVIAVFHDISELKTQERLRRDLVANVSHELRTPLSIIHGYVETLLDGALDDRPTAERFLRVVHRHGERLNLLIEDLLTMSRLESGALPLVIEPVDLREAVRAVLERMEAAVRERGARVTVEFGEGFPVIPADAHRIDQLLFNLLDNALKFGPAGRAEIRVTGRAEAGEVTVEVADNGPGVPAEDQPHLFERFYRVHKDRNRDAGGTGLGLSIVRQIALAHGGSVGLESVPGHGAVFRVTLPRTRPG